MSSLYVVNGPTFANALVKTLPAIAGLSTIAFFGSGASLTTIDRIETNRVAGGPALLPIGAAPTYSSNYVTLGGATGTVATATASVSGGAVSISGFTGGLGYARAPAVSFTGGGGTGAAAQAKMSGGVVTGVTMTDAGSGYTSAPTVVFTGGLGCAIDTQNPRTSAIVASGFTWMAVCRVPSAGSPSQIFSDVNGPANPNGAYGYTFGMTLQNSDAGTPTLEIMENGSAQTLACATAATNWHCVSMTFSGSSGSGGTFQGYDLTDGTSSSSASVNGSVLSNGLSPTLGGDGSSPNNINTADFAFAMVANSPLSLSAQQVIYASVKSILGRRGIST